MMNKIGHMNCPKVLDLLAFELLVWLTLVIVYDLL